MIAAVALVLGVIWVDQGIDSLVTEGASEEAMIARMIANQLDQTIRAGKFVLAGAALRAESGGDFELGLDRALFDLAPRLVIEPQFLALSFLDATGRLVRASDGRSPSVYCDQVPEFFEGVAGGREFHFGYAHRADGSTELVLAHRLEDTESAFLGVAALTIDLDRMRKSLKATVEIEDRKILAVRADGVALFRFPDDGSAIGRDLSELPYAEALAADGTQSTFSIVSAFDGTKRVGGFAVSPERNFLVMSSRTRNQLLRGEIIGAGRATLIVVGLMSLAGIGVLYASAELRHRRRMVDERDELLSGLDVAEAAIAIADAETQEIRFVNSAFERMTGYTAAEMMGRNCRVLQGPASAPEAVARLRDAIAASKPVRVEILNYRKDGTPYWSDLSIAPIRRPDGTAKGFVSAFLDVTARVRMTDKLSEALARAHAADRAKSTFLARMSHELRTPLNAIIGFAEVMRLRLMGPLSDRYADYAGDILDSGRHLLDLVERILEMSQIESDGRVFETSVVDLSAVARAAVTLARASLDAATVQLILDLSDAAPALGDPTALRQIALNLLVNAARHGRKGGTIRVRTCALHNDRVLLEVTDDGPGIAPDVIEKLGTPFLNRRADTADGEGVGLGLAISMELAKRMGGTLEIVNANPGARATLIVPNAAAARNAM